MLGSKNTSSQVGRGGSPLRSRQTPLERLSALNIGWYEMFYNGFVPELFSNLPSDSNHLGMKLSTEVRDHGFTVVGNYPELQKHSKNLKFVALLRAGYTEDKDSLTLLFRATADLTVVQIKGKEKMDTFDFSSASLRSIPAGSYFEMTYIELFFTLLRPEFNGICEAPKEEEGIAFLSLKTTLLIEGVRKLPTPVLQFHSGDIRSYTRYTADARKEYSENWLNRGSAGEPVVFPSTIVDGLVPEHAKRRKLKGIPSHDSLVRSIRKILDDHEGNQ